MANDMLNYWQGPEALQQLTDALHIQTPPTPPDPFQQIEASRQRVASILSRPEAAPHPAFDQGAAIQANRPIKVTGLSEPAGPSGLSIPG